MSQLLQESGPHMPATLGWTSIFNAENDQIWALIYTRRVTTQLDEIIQDRRALLLFPNKQVLDKITYIQGYRELKCLSIVGKLVRLSRTDHKQSETRP